MLVLSAFEGKTMSGVREQDQCGYGSDLSTPPCATSLAHFDTSTNGSSISLIFFPLRTITLEYPCGACLVVTTGANALSIRRSRSRRRFLDRVTKIGERLLVQAKLVANKDATT